MRPDDIPQGIWDEACEAMNRAGWYMTSARIACARAILAERKRNADLVEAFPQFLPMTEADAERYGILSRPASRKDIADAIRE